MRNLKNPFFSRLIELVAFLIAFIILSTSIMNILIIKGEPVGPRMYSVYESYARGTDVLFAGSSHAGQLIGRQLFSDYGIATFTVAGDSQPVDIMYHSIVDFLKYQKPKVIMVETALIPDENMFEPDTTYYGKMENNAVYRWSPNYLQMIAEQIRNFDLPIKTEGIQLLYKWPLMHDRYKNLTRDDISIVRPYLSTDTDPIYSVPEQEVQIVTTEDRQPLSDVGQEYLYKIIKLCKKKNIPLVLFHTPYPAPEMSMAQQNTIADIAAQEGIPFIDFNYLIDEVGLDLQSEQARDMNHLNYYGAQKLTAYLGQYLTENYSLPDRREDPDYDNWNKDLEAWDDVLVKRDFESTSDIETWAGMLAEQYQNYVVIMTLSGNYKVAPEGLLQRMFDSVGASDEFYDKGGTLVLDHGNIAFYSGDQLTYVFSQKFSDAQVAVDRKISNDEFTSQAPNENNNDGIYIWGDNYVKAVNGLSITIYGDRCDYIIDSVGMDFYTSGSDLFREAIKY